MRPHHCRRTAPFLFRTRVLLPGAVAFGMSLAALAASASGPEIVPGPPAATARPAPVSTVAGNPRRSPVVEVVERVRGAVVNIHSEKTVSHSSDDVFHAGPNRVNGMGTGIVIDPRGYIVTNHHVVEDVQVLRVRTADGNSYPAKVFARDPETDLALLKIEPKAPLPLMPLGTAGDLMIGEQVVAIGNAFGYEHTVTRGIVSATKRDVTLNKEISYKSLIQTDASINPGNSGGPLINMQGELVGVNVAIRAGAQGIGFAIPVDQMIRVAADMLAGRKRNPPLHNLTLKDCVAPGSSPAIRSVVVEQMGAVTQAADAGVHNGDQIVKVGDTAVISSLDFERALLGKKAGDNVNVTVNREGHEKVVELALRPADKGGNPVDVIWRRLGIKLVPATPDTVHRVNGQLQGGLHVSDLNPEGIAAKSGIMRGDILIGLHQWETLSLDNVLFVINHPDAGSFGRIQFFVIRGGQVRKGLLQ